MRAETVEEAPSEPHSCGEGRKEHPKPSLCPVMPSTGEPCWQPAREQEAGSLQESTGQGRGGRV